MQQIIDEVSRCLQAISPKLSDRDYAKLRAIKVPRVHQFIVEAAELCNPEKIFVSDDSLEDIAYIRRMAIETGEEKPLAMPGHTVHFDGPYDQGRDREATK
ncbi:MAG: phosphoenolpyruvate carboxykinase, partial [Candidatus Bathyarchaeia archaeon]